jgi:hypothetical protein
MKKVMLAGLLGGLAMIAWLILVDGILGFKRGIDMNRLQEEREVYGFLLEHVAEPGRYVVNPEVVPEQGFPGGDPIFAVHYTGLGHQDAGQEVLVGLVVIFLSCTAGAWLVANASDRVRSRYSLRVVFFGMIGLVASLLGLGARFGLAVYPFSDALTLSFHDLVAWMLAGLLVAKLVEPPPDSGEMRAV